MTGTAVEITTSNNTSVNPVQLVVNGLKNFVNLGTGSAEVNAVGGGAIVESVQLVSSNGNPISDLGKAFSLGGGDPATGGVAYNGGLVDTSAQVSGNSVSAPKESISAAAGSLTPAGAAGFGFYAHGGTGNDAIVGSIFSDFIRGGGGNDLIDASDGNDLVRAGTGSDSITLGLGFDTLYYTTDQVGGNNVDTLTDFLSGTDKIAVQGGVGIGVFDAAGNAFTVSSAATNTIVFKAGASQTTLTNTGAGRFLFSDILFLA
jgi:Ca2+-binding RTX toxin-like protein